MDAAQTEKLKALALAATPGPWQWWTSNSTLRLTGADGKDGGVLYGYAHSGVGDVSCSDANRAFIAAANPATVLELIADHDKTKLERDELRAEVERLRADSKRYQWLDNKSKRDGRDGGYWGYYVLPMLVGWSYARGADSFDYKTLGAAIDAAIKEEKA